VSTAAARDWLLAFALCLLSFARLSSAQAPTALPSFDEWLSNLRAEALAGGISQATLDAALNGLAPEPVILSRDRTQPEQTQSLEAYLSARLSPRTVSRARTAAADQRQLLERIRATYGVPGPILIAIWAIESNFGQFVGVRPTVSALATLAYDSRRPDLFRAELFNALTILDRGLVPAADLKGSWAGAMGQPQFMPSSYLKYAVDFDGDGHANIWTSAPDVFASMANYLSLAGWTSEDQSWGREVSISKPALARIERTVPMRTVGCRALRDTTEARQMSEWSRLGVTLPGGRRLPAPTLSASLVRGQRRQFLVYPNYAAIIDYNCSNAYGISVGLLADLISTTGADHK
jgi:membrane-bound lytic murein transglycosylase B